jgi:hypothetical protein
VKPFLLLLGLCALLLGGGFVNYQRNAGLDKDLQFRPYAGYSDKDLDAMRKAYEKQVGQMRSGLGEVDQSRIARTKPSDYQSKLREFERFQKENERWKEGHREMLGSQVVVDAIKKEQEIRRAGLDNPWNRILRRATTF